ncbi:16S rRNA (guanine(527)-N(7))-methyltransferase RsmG [Candidatus Korobacter versatilis]|nr:16S rRNA (guanine(527)-N(7))-methyltransferase RsmG [Candidatus Koribacter versatilis]
MPGVEIARIAELLDPIVVAERQLEQISVYLDLLLKWNARMNLTAVRDPEQIVLRHFGESLFAARELFPDPDATGSLVDVGSGAGFPGVPIAIERPGLSVTLIEAHGKKATFLKEVVRSTRLTNASVQAIRAEEYVGVADVVTMRAVEEFASILPVSARLVRPGGRLACLLGSPQAAEAEGVIGECWRTERTVYFPGSTQRVLWIGQRAQK